VLIAAGNGFDDDGDRKSSIYVVTRSGDQPAYISLGLLEAGRGIINGSWGKVGDSDD